MPATPIARAPARRHPIRLLFLPALMLFVALSGACSPRPPATPAPTQVGTSAASVSTASATTATPAAPSELQWQVDIVQGGQVLPGETGEVSLARAPFTLRVTLPQPMPVSLNVLDSDQNFVALQPGFVFTVDCMQALCSGMAVAEDRLNPQKTLFVDALSTHYLYYNDAEDNRWSRSSVSATSAIFERDVDLLNTTPVEQVAAPALYLLFMVNPANPDVIDPGELKKVILSFS